MPQSALKSGSDAKGSDCVPLIARSLRLAARGVVFFAAALTLLVLLGWAIRVPTLVSLVPRAVGMNPAVAVLLWVCAVALWILCDRPDGDRRGGKRAIRALAKTAAGLVALVGLVMLVGLLSGHAPPIDQVLFGDRLDLVPGQPPNRMAPNTGIALLLLGLAVSLIDVTVRRRGRPSELLAIAAAMVALLGIVGYLYSVTSLYHVRTFIPMAFNSALVVGALALAVLLGRPDQGMMSIISSDSLGGVTARRLLPATILVPIALGWLRIEGRRWGLTDAEFGSTLVILGNIFFFVLLVWSTAGLMRRADLRRRQSEAALAAERTMLRTLLDNLPDGIFIKDAQGRYITCNTAHARFLGRPGPESMTGKTVYDLYPADVAAIYDGYDRAVIDARQPMAKREDVLTDSEGQPHWSIVSKVPVMDARGNVSGLVGITTDITEQVQARQQLREQNEKLNEMAQSERAAHEALKRAQGQLVQTEKLAGLGQLVAGVAHEINNPLSFVNNNVAVLQRDLAGLKSLVVLYQQVDASLANTQPELMTKIAELRERLDLAYTLSNLEEMIVRSREGLRRIQQIVKDLRDFARLDESDLHEVDLNQGVESTVNIIRGRAKSRDVAIELDLGTLPPVGCYPAKINQVIMNLLANAIDASSSGGKVTIRTRAAPPGTSDAAIPSMVCIEVIDAGSGMSPEVRQRIFDPFFTTKPQGQGTGLGLSISYGIVRDHHGTIEVESAAGKGSRFIVTLPVRHARLGSGPRSRQP
jgi:PAS domain S-box-containing protein